MDIEINKRVLKYRKKSGMLQIDVAQALNMKLSTYSQMERLGDISAERIRKLADIFKIDVRVLLYGENFESTPSNSTPNFPPDGFVLLPLPQSGMSYYPVHNIESSIISIYRNELTKENQKQICKLLDSLRKNKKQRNIM